MTTSTDLRQLVRDRDHIFISTGTAEPRHLLDSLVDEVAPVMQHLTVFQVLTGASGRSVEVGEFGHCLKTVAPAAWSSEPGVQTLDCSMGQVRLMIDAGTMPVDGALISALRRGDKLYPVPATDLTMSAVARARFVAVEVCGEASAKLRAPSISAMDVDLLVDGNASMPEFLTPESDSRTEVIGELIAQTIPAGAIMQLGVGRALSSVADAIISAKVPIAIHTGLISDWAMRLVEAGSTHRRLPCSEDRTTVGAVAMGSGTFQAWAQSSSSVEFVGSGHAHDPAHLATLSPFVAINSAMAVALDGSVGLPPGVTRSYGPGGLMDFAIGGAFGGMSIIALTARSGRGHDRIVSRLESVHLPPSMVTHVVTEYGIADIAGLSVGERSERIARLAHPDSRSRLLEGATI